MKKILTLIILAVVLTGCGAKIEKNDIPDKAPGSVEEVQDNKDNEKEEKELTEVMGIELLDTESINKTISGKSKMSAGDASISLSYNGTPLACLKNHKTFYLTLDYNRKGWGSGKLEGMDGYRLVADSSLVRSDPEVMTEHSNALMVYVVGESDYAVVDLMMTYLPVITIDFDDGNGDVWGDARACDLALHNTTEKNRDKAYMTSRAEVMTRGGSSKSLPKPGLKVSLKTEDGDGNKLKLLGMRKDDDWILTAMFSDEAKVRDMVCWQLWREMKSEFPGMNGSAAPENKYVEVLINGKYHGLFLLMERFDAKTLGLEEGDTLFKTKTWDVPSSKDVKKQKASSEMCAALEKKFPKPEEKVEGSWDAIGEYVRVCYETDGSGFKKEIDQIADVENQLDYWLFNNITMAADNTWKNAYFAYKDGKVYTLPWDLDITLGLGWTGDISTNYLAEDPGLAERTYDFQAGRRLIKYYDGASDYIRKRWNELKKNDIASADALIEHAEYYWDLINKSGAIRREKERWPNGSYVDDLDYLKTTIKRRVSWMNNYIISLD